MKIIPIEYIPDGSILEKTILKLKEISMYIYHIKDTNHNRDDLFKKNHTYCREIKKLSEELVDSILTNKNSLINLITFENIDNYTYQHSVNVAVLSIAIGIALNLNRATLVELTIGALLHDIGKVFIPKEIINKRGPLTDEEYSIIKTHPKLAYDYLNKYFDLTPSSLLICLEHHERIDGTGYPKQLTGDKIHYLSKIVSIADVYDALTSARSYKKAFSASESLKFIIANSNSMFDCNIVKVFMKLVVSFPLGTSMHLRNKDTDHLRETHTNFPLHSNMNIKKILDKNSEDSFINLVNRLSLMISEV